MTIDMATMPKETKDIFDTLRGGNFIIDDHPESYQRRLYSICDVHYSKLFAYFEILGYTLTAGDGYFVFSTELGEPTRAHRMNQLLTLIDLVYLFRGSFGNFDVGWSGSPSELELALKNDIVKMERLERLRGISGSTVNEMCESAFKRLQKFGCMIKIDEKLDIYKLVSPYNYIKEYLISIQRINDAEASTKEMS